MRLVSFPLRSTDRYRFPFAKAMPIVAMALAAVTSASCATYTDSTREIRDALYANEYTTALEKLDKSSIARSSADAVLYRMERGSILYLNGKYELAAKEWDLASRRIDALYTVSLSKQAASLAINESFADYEGELHERVLLPIFSGLAYFASGEPDKAIVEARRTNEILQVVNENAKGKKNVFSRDAFAHYLSGLIYEAKEEWDAAIVEYRKALDAAEGNKQWQAEVSSRPIAESLARLAEFRKRSELVAQATRLFPDLRWSKLADLREKGEVYIVYESGKSPLKVPQDVPVPIDNGVVNISFPVYKRTYYSARSASVFVDNVRVGETIVMEDVGKLAEQALSDRRGRDITRMIARVIAKDQASRAAGRAAGNLGPLVRLATSVAGAVTERADTRSWTSLPDTIQVLRVAVPSGKVVRVKVDPNVGPPREFTVNLRPGEKKLVRLRTFD
ncbi:MAG: tetratricopeptide repeat protein [Silvanigrellales bacterium]|jgi:hypothetical protein|nr:tetratricopeptide repeat protein [Silvanigrellales bacterium]